MAAANKIVVIDDDTELVAFTTDILRREGYEVASACNGQEGLEVVRREKPDVVLLDLAMPVMHGFQVCRAIRADDSLRGVRIVAISGKSYPVDLQTAKAEGADHYLVKPLSAPHLLDLIERLLVPGTIGGC